MSFPKIDIKKIFGTPTDARLAKEALFWKIYDWSLNIFILGFLLFLIFFGH